MIKKIVLTVLLLVISIHAHTACHLPKNEYIKIGCSYNCDITYRFRILMAAFKLGHKIEFVEMNKLPDIHLAMKEVDAVLIPGGADIDPRYYWDSVSEDLREYTKKNLKLVNFSKEGRERDPFEYSLVKNYSSSDEFKHLPLLGICRGMQMMSVVQGIPLYLDIKTELGIKNRYNTFDTIVVDSQRDSLMHSLFTDNTFRAFKLHHQGIRVPYYTEHQAEFPQVQVTAFSHHQKIAETLEYTHRPALGVQFHPEKSFAGTANPILTWFLTKACEYKSQYKKENK